MSATAVTIVTLPIPSQDSNTMPVPAHLILLLGSHPLPVDFSMCPSDQPPSGALSLQETGSEEKGTPNLVRGSVNNADLEVPAVRFPPNIRPIIKACPWTIPPPFMVRAGDAIVSERMRKTFCAATGCPIVPLRTCIIPTPASFGESRVSLEARRAELKRAGHSFYRADRDIEHETCAPEILFTADQSLPLKNFPTYVICVRYEELGPTGSSSAKDVPFVVHKQVLAAFFAHLGPKLESSVTISPTGHSDELIRFQWLPVFTVLHGQPDVYNILLEYVYKQEPETFLRSMLGNRVFSQISPCTEEILYHDTPHTISAPPIALRRAAVQIQEEHSYREIIDILYRLDEIFVVADDLGLESPPFWNALACARRILLDAGSISYLHHLRAMVDAEAASCV